MTVAQAIDPSGTATTQFTDADGLNPRNSPPYEDGYVVHTFSSTTAGQKLRVTEGGNVDVVVGAEASQEVAVLANNSYAVLVGSGSSSYALGVTAAGGGSVVVTYSYTEAESIPSVTTQHALGIYSTYATLNGTLTHTGGMTGLTVYFQYGLSTGNVDDNSTTEAYVYSTGAFAFVPSGLTPESQYQFRAVVTDGSYVWYGSILVFATTAISDVPLLITYPAMNVTPTTARMVGTVVVMGGNTSLDVYFEYGKTTSYGTTTTPETIVSETAAGNYPDPSGQIQEDLTGLDAETEYHYRVVATNGTSYWYGSDRIFYTGESGESGYTYYEIEYGPTDEGHETVTGTAGATDSNTTTIVDTGLDTFYDQLNATECTLYRARVRYWDGTEYSDWSDWLEVSTLCPTALAVTTSACTDVVSDGASLNGDLTNMGGHAAVDVYFRVTLKSDTVYTLVEETAAASVDAIGAFTASVTGLERATQYSIFAIASKEAEIVIGNEIILVTDGLIVSTFNASSIGTTTATLNGELVSLNGEASLDVYFEYGNNFENTTSAQTKSALGFFTQALTGLVARTEYVFRAVATDGTNIWYGEAFTFTTTFEAIVTTFYPSDITKISATLEGSINMSLASANYYFQYGFTTSYGNTTTSTAITETDGPEAVEAGITGLVEDTTYHCRLVLLDGTTYYYGNDIVFRTVMTKTVTSHNEGLWLFDADDNTKHWSTMAQSYNGTTYTAAVVPNSFDGVESRVSLGTGLISSSDLTFDLYFDDSTTITNYLDSLEGTDLLITLATGEGINADVSKRWRFYIERATYAYGVIRCHCKSLLQYHLVGDWPKTENPQEIWPSSDPDIYPNYCVPVIFGTAYIPIKSVNTGEGTPPAYMRKYVLGPDGPTYDVEEIKAPRERGTSTWSSGSYTFTQSSHNGYRLCEFLIDETVGPPFGNGIWVQGAVIQIPFVKYSRSDTSAMTNPADWIEYILRDIGVKSSYIDTGSGSTFAIAKQIFASRGLVWGGGFWEKQPREVVLADLLSMCDAFLYESDKIELHVFTTSSHEYFDKTLERTFSVNPTLITQNDGGGVEWPALDDAQDVFPGKTNINVDPFEDGVSNPTKSPFQYRFQYGTVIPQKAAILHYQKQHTKNRVSFGSSVLDINNFNTLIPGKVVTLYNPKIFRLLKGIIITSMMVKYNLTVDFDAVELTYMNQWNDLDPDPVTIVTDATEGTMT